MSRIPEDAYWLDLMSLFRVTYWSCGDFFKAIFIWGNYLHDSTNRDSLYLLNDNSDHCLHHYYGENNYNFAYYFNYWDIIFRTYKKT